MPDPASHKIAYRTEIDGLRAVAVVPVILFHAGIPWVSGGYVGVDVFFVISGYLITRILLDAHQSSTYSIIDFYKRRCVRILPALTVVTAASFAAAWLWMAPQDLQKFSKSVIAVATFSSNILFWRESGYFDVQAELKPLLHTWSLAVEEQYYIIFPVVLGLIWRLAPRLVLPALVAAAVAGLYLSGKMVRYAPEAAYFLLPSRAWEILAGSIIAALQGLGHSSRIDSIGNRTAELLAATGLGAIAVSVFLFTSTTRFPGYNALVPVLGTALILLFVRRGGLCHRLLSSRPLQLIGLSSYSSYLWHQPVLAFARLRSAHALSPLEELGLAAVSVALGFLTWKFIEIPARSLHKLDAGRVLSLALASCLLTAALGLAALQAGGFSGRFPKEVIAFLDTPELETGAACTYFDASGAAVPPGCAFGDPGGKKAIALYGDSHAQALLAMLDREFKRLAIRGLRVNVTQCEPIPDIMVQGLPEDRFETCRQAFDQTLDFLKREADGIIVAIRWNYRLYPVPGEIDRLTFDNGEGGVELDKERIYEARDESGERSILAPAKERAVKRLFQKLEGTGLPVSIVHPIPETGIDIKRYNFIRYLEEGRLPDEVTTSYERYRSRNAFSGALLDGITGPKIFHVYPDRALCDTFVKDRCVVQHGGKRYYSDDDHLSEEGASLLAGEILHPFLGDFAAQVRLSGEAGRFAQGSAR
ncbi:acyltransferase family protein [Shinella sp. BYT-45]|uniref:acyltransferase family protein n=1 Tax=Shinella sp. BYT-45 TaxID=3377377 RepID=UPI00397E9781